MCAKELALCYYSKLVAKKSIVSCHCLTNTCRSGKNCSISSMRQKKRHRTDSNHLKWFALSVCTIFISTSKDLAHWNQNQNLFWKALCHISGTTLIVFTPQPITSSWELCDREVTQIWNSCPVTFREEAVTTDGHASCLLIKMKHGTQSVASTRFPAKFFMVWENDTEQRTVWEMELLHQIGD